MNKTAIKNYAIWARAQLIEAAKQRAYEYEITEDLFMKSSTPRGEKNLAVPFVGRTWLGPAK